MVGCYQVTKFFCQKYCFASASSRSPFHLGSPAFKDIANLSREKCVREQAPLDLQDFVRKRSSEARLMSFFLFLFWVFGESRAVSWCGFVTSL